MRDRRHAHGSVQHPLRFGQVVGIGRFASDMQRRRLVRHRSRSVRELGGEAARIVHRTLRTRDFVYA
jgi:hypothetical protein